MYPFLSGIEDDIQKTIDQNLTLAATALNSNNVRNADQFVKAAATENMKLMPVNMNNFTVNQAKINSIVEQIDAKVKAGLVQLNPQSTAAPNTSSSSILDTALTNLQNKDLWNSVGTIGTSLASKNKEPQIMSQPYSPPGMKVGSSNITKYMVIGLAGVAGLFVISRLRRRQG